MPHYPITKSIGGQRFYEFEDYYAFILEDGLFKKAGKNVSTGGHWPEEVESGKLKSPGIGMNTGIYKTVMKNRDKELVVYNKRADEFYVLKDYRLLTEYASVDTQKGKKIVVTPIDAYRVKQDVSDLDPKITELKSHVRRARR